MDTEISRLLEEFVAGDKEAFDRLVDRIYDDLRRMAHRQLGKGRPGSLDTTGLVHDAYLKLVDQERPGWKNRSHFFSIASLAMRSIVVDYARRLQSAKRGGSKEHVTADGELADLERQVEEVLAVHQALGRLEGIDPRMVKIVEHRYFAGLTEKETAEALGVSLRTAQRLWKESRQWLRGELGR